MPSGYDIIELEYRTNAGDIVVVSDRFGKSETGCGWFYAPKFNLSNGPDEFWISVRNGSTGRSCNGGFDSQYYQPGTVNRGCRIL